MGRGPVRRDVLCSSPQALERERYDPALRPAGCRPYEQVAEAADSWLSGPEDDDDGSAAVPART
ncbi:hypothetical protein SSIG_03642 [Streptomyces filamentosus NRRL 11379]|nr:hypothetical protein SSIG_03642 [Streptomyces filamentosus NRRL 11379]